MQVFEMSCIDAAPRLSASLNDQIRLFGDGLIGSGRAYTAVWHPLAVSRFHKPRDRKIRPYLDISFILAKGSTPVFSKLAKTCLTPVLGDTVQWLPVDFDEQEFWLVNVLESVSFDTEKSKITTYLGGGTGAIEQFAFDELTVKDKRLFKVKQKPIYVLCTERLRECVIQNQLTGFHFSVVWDSRYNPFPAGLDNNTDVIGRPEIYGPYGIKPIDKEFRHKFWPLEWFELETAKK